MKFIYGKQDWSTFQRGEETCFLMTNGLGGFCSLTAIGSCARNEHGVLMACEHAPNRRVQMIQRLKETLSLDGKAFPLSSQDFEDHSLREDGRTCQSGFTFRDYPQWTYLVHGVEVVKRLAMAPEENTVAMVCEVHNRGRQTAILQVTPHLRFVPKGEPLVPGQSFTLEENRIRSQGRTLYFETSGAVRPLPQAVQGPFRYAQDAMDGKPAAGWAVVNHCVELSVPPGEHRVLEAIYGTALPLPAAGEVFERLEEHNRALEQRAGFADEAARTLTRAAGQFLSRRESTGKQTILAGFPFFEDWGRDTMIALGGCCLATHRYDEARSILETFLVHCHRGLMPNLFPEGKDAPRYNTVDASLLFILSVYDYFTRTGDRAFVEEAYDAMADIIGWYEKGTDFAIRMEEDGLISAGSGLDQVTWMDVNVDGILPTPRHGKPVEINAYWYNALRILERFQPLLGRGDGSRYAAMAERTRASFVEKFWNGQAGCLRDVLSGTKADEQIRCNQIWAVSLPFSILSHDQELQVVETVFERLYTPYGLRTLDPADPEFQPFYGGDRLKRDLAYHQGTVWTFPLGGYYLAYLKVHNHSRQAADTVRRQLEAIRSALREGCAGQLPEIYDGGDPISSKGCFAQAWSVGELLRVYEKLEEIERDSKPHAGQNQANPRQVPSSIRGGSQLKEAQLMLDKMQKDWWKSAVFYQVYPKSFQDTNGDGIGDLRGIIQRLNYLEKLGIDGIWLSPVYASPQRDNGYDISDYRAVHPAFGTMEDMEELIAQADRRGITIIMDLVLNHTSDQHRWFLEAKTSRNNPYHDYYIWRDGTPDCPPNDMKAVFGGSAWTYVPEVGQYYFNCFSSWQPDLNWANPTVRQELCDMIRFWTDKGVGGFRLDVIDNIGKEPDRKIVSNGPMLHKYIRELRQKAFPGKGIVTVGEAWSASVDTARQYANPDGSELSMVFQFEHMCLDCEGEKWDVKPLPLATLKKCYERWQTGLAGQGWNSLFLENHDLPRIVSRWGDDGKYRVESAKMLAVMCHGMQGTPYIYQGEELGMTNIRLPIEAYDDLEIQNVYRERLAKGYAPEDVMASIYARGRDNARTPMQWSSGPCAGFSTAKPWLPVNPNCTEINAEAALADPDSLFHFYQTLIALRKKYLVFRDGGFTLLDPEDEHVFAYTRDTEGEHLLVVCNFTAREQPRVCPEAFQNGEVLLSNYKDTAGVLRPYEAQMLYSKSPR